MAAPNIILVGCGKMGGAMLSGWLEGRIADQVVVVEPTGAAAAFKGKPGVHVCASPDAITAHMRPDILVFAVKPQNMAEIIPAYRRFVSPNAVFLSIAAGTPIALFETHLGRHAGIVRAMPNTPAAVGRGVTVMVANRNVDPNQIALCHGLMSAVGETAWVGDERLMDAVTAVSGSGPAYVFLLVECLAAAGVAAGLPKDLAMQLARTTVSGAGELLHRADDPAETLRRNVTSPGGTTAAALSVLMAGDGLGPLMERAVAAATARSKELGA